MIAGKVAEADLDVVVRSLAKKQVKARTDAARKRHSRFMGMAGKAKDKQNKEHGRLLPEIPSRLRSAAARRPRTTAANRAYSYVRSIKKAAEEYPAAKSGKKVAKTKKG
jgi:hypothetical protein